MPTRDLFGVLTCEWTELNLKLRRLFYTLPHEFLVQKCLLQQKLMKLLMHNVCKWWGSVFASNKPSQSAGKCRFCMHLFIRTIESKLATYKYLFPSNFRGRIHVKMYSLWRKVPTRNSSKEQQSTTVIAAIRQLQYADDTLEISISFLLSKIKMFFIAWTWYLQNCRSTW